MQQYLLWAGVDHCPTMSADDPEANGLVERFMQEIGNSWESAYVEGKNPLAALNAKLKMYRNTEHSVTKRKPAEWLFGRVIRTRLPDRQLQTRHESEASLAARERMEKRAQFDKGRRDPISREEHLEVGMQVLLKEKVKRKGRPRYDPKPYTIIELVGRQAVIQRGEKVLRRETKKIKRFFESSDLVGSSSKLVVEPENDEWEEQSCFVNIGTQQCPDPVIGATNEVSNSEIVEEQNNMHQLALEQELTGGQLSGTVSGVENKAALLPPPPLRRSGRERRPPKRFGE